MREGPLRVRQCGIAFLLSNHFELKSENKKTQHNKRKQTVEPAAAGPARSLPGPFFLDQSEARTISNSNLDDERRQTR